MLLGGLYKFSERADGFISVKSDTKEYSIDPENMTCSCADFLFRCYKEKGRQCKHIKLYLEAKGDIDERNNRDS